MTEPTSGPEPTEERRPTSDNWPQLVMDMGDLLYDIGGATDEWKAFESRRDDLMPALLAAEPEHLPGRQPDSAD